MGGVNKARECEITSPVLKQLLDKWGGAGCHKFICDRNHLGVSALPEGLFTGCALEEKTNVCSILKAFKADHMSF